MTGATRNLLRCVSITALLALSPTLAKAQSSSDGNYPAVTHWYKNTGNVNLFSGYVKHKERTAPRGGASRTCLTAETRAVLNRLEARFGTVKVISTCRPGAVIAGTNRPSYHRYGKAVDFNVPRGVSKQTVVQWLYANNRGVVMTYRSMGHVHFDTGSYHKIAYGGGKATKRYVKRHSGVAYASKH